MSGLRIYIGIDAKQKLALRCPDADQQSVVEGHHVDHIQRQLFRHDGHASLAFLVYCCIDGLQSEELHLQLLAIEEHHFSM